ncbi:hypothetical protein [Methanoculleus sp.]|jgi:hypothetical protein|uniref:hypothetical protein n=1 Tax=Methanoculleus sp. TaxID=90427 RepID=UPI0025F6B89E|nr:hypothetical protein [Methanoculleus sp.]MCK9320149.1 hypothetical protein [Methanoculleus sp.]
MSSLTKILKTSGSLTEVAKTSGNSPALRYLEATSVKMLRLLEDGGKRLLENSTTDSVSINKTSATLNEILKT